MEKKLLVTSEAIFLERHQFLFKALANHFEVQFLPRKSEWYEAKVPRSALKGWFALRSGSRSRANSIFQKNKFAFLMKSRRVEQTIGQLDAPPDLVFQMFGTYRPWWKVPKTPYVMYLDYTTALAEKNWPDWATFLDARSRDDWFECEGSAYRQARHIFCMSSVVKDSLIQDYSILPQKIKVVGSSGDFQQTYGGEKVFGGQKILFNGSDFERKGGDLVLAAFRQVRQAIPTAKLIILGKKVSIDEPGIENPGQITSRSALHQLFLESDLAIAPALCDPFPTFLMEAMNYGVPCVVSNQDGMPEIVDHQKTGIVLDQLSAEALADVVIHLLSHSETLLSMSQSAREKVKVQLNWAAIAAQIADTISSFPSPDNEPASSNDMSYSKVIC